MLPGHVKHSPTEDRGAQTLVTTAKNNLGQPEDKTHQDHMIATNNTHRSLNYTSEFRHKIYYLI